MKTITIDSDLNLFSDDIKIETSSLETSLSNVIRKTPKRTQVSFGFGPSGNPDEIGKVTNAYLLGMSTSISAKGEISINLSCQDSNYKLQYGFFKKIFFYRKPVNTQGVTYTPKDELNEDIDFEVGYKKVKDIIEDAVNSVDSSINVIWESGVYNYEIVDKNHPYQSYDGSVSSVISSLLEPLQHSEMYRVQALMINESLHIRKQFLSSKTRKVKMNFEEMYNKQVSINYTRLVGSDIKHIIIEYSKDTDVDISVVTTKTIENNIDPQTNNLISSVVRYMDKILDVVIEEREEFYRGVDGQVVLVSYTTTNYTYDVPPTELDEDGRFKPHRKLVEKTINQKNYLIVFVPVGSITPEQRITDIVTEIDTTINYNYNSKDELIDESEKVETKSYGVLTETRRILTVYKIIKKNLIETLRTTYINAEATNIISIITEGRLQKASTLLYNSNESLYFEKKYIKENGTGNTKDQIVYLSSEYLPLAELKLIAKEIIKERQYIKVTISIDGLALPHLNRGDEISFSGKLLIGRMSSNDLPVLVSGTNKYEATKTEVIAFSQISDTPMIIESQNFTTNVNGSEGSVILTGYKQLI